MTLFWIIKSLDGLYVVMQRKIWFSPQAQSEWDAMENSDARKHSRIDFYTTIQMMNGW